MTFGVFVHRSDSRYDDRPDERYQFPPQYLRRVEACVGDWIVYYEPTKIADTRGYFAVAKVQEVIADPLAAGMYLALIEPGSYLDFLRPVPFKNEDGVIERGVLNQLGRNSGRAQAAVRPVAPADFDRILALGLGEAAALPRLGNPEHQPGFAQDQVPFVFEQDRRRIAVLSSRPVRDRIFRTMVLRAYDCRCAVTGLRLINGGGRAEVNAAHIRPVERNGPDLLMNGIALSGTAHWMFDRGLIGLGDDLTILISRHVNDPDGVRGMVNATGRALVPPVPTARPHPRFLQWHRETCFKR